MTPDPRCQELHDDLAAAATGTLTGRRRAEVLHHVERCPACAAELDALALVVEDLMTLVPGAEPPAGFADRTIALMRTRAGADGRDLFDQEEAAPGSVRPPPSGRRRAGRWSLRPVLAAAAVVVALGLGVGIGDLVVSSGGVGGRPAPPAVRTADLHLVTGDEGSVVVTTGRPGWLVMSVEAGGWGTVTCQVTLADGSHRMVARYPIEAGYGSWTARLPVPGSAVRSVQLVDDQGSTVAWARLPTMANS